MGNNINYSTLDGRRYNATQPLAHLHQLRAQPLKVGSISKLCGPATEHELGFWANCSTNLVRGLVNRVFMYKGQPLRYEIDVDYAESVDRLWRRAVQPFRRLITPTAPLTRDAYLSYYSGRKLSLYESAFSSLDSRPLTARDADVPAFIKKEKDKGGSSAADPRIIQPRSVRFSVSFGRYIRAFEHKMFRSAERRLARVAGNPLDSRSIAKGMNYRDRGQLFWSKWASLRRPSAVCVDASRFDLHVHHSALSSIDKIYMDACPRDFRDELSKLLQWRRRVRGLARCGDGLWKYELPLKRLKRGDGSRTNLYRGVRRCSGDNDTSLGNVLIMFVINAEIVRRFHLAGGGRIDVINDGDDEVFFVEREDNNLLRALIDTVFDEMGFRATVEDDDPQCLEEIEFCQTRPVMTTAGHYVMCRKPLSVLGKDLATFLPIDNVREQREMLYAVGACGTIAAAGITLYEQYYRKMLEASKYVHGTNLRVGTELSTWWRRSGVNTDPLRFIVGMDGVVDPRSNGWIHRLSFFRAWRITPDEQLLIEQLIRDTPLTPSSEIRYVHKLTTNLPLTPIPKSI